MSHDEKLKRCLVTGATGVVGMPLVSELIRRGHSVRLLSRHTVSKGQFPVDVEIVIGDLHDEKTLATATNSIDWIFHLAAKLHVNSPDDKLKDEYFQTNVAATRNLLKFATSAEKFIFFSTISVYGKSEGNYIFDETSAVSPAGFYAETKFLAEKDVLASRNSKGEQIGVVLRLGAVYGSRVKGNYLRLLHAIKKGRFVFVDGGMNRRTLIHQSDVARAAILAATKANGGTLYNVTDGRIYTVREIVEAICIAVGRRSPRFSLPRSPLQIALNFASAISGFLGISLPINSELLKKLVEDIAVSGEKFRRELGFEPTVDLKDGWRETLKNISFDD